MSRRRDWHGISFRTVTERTLALFGVFAFLAALLVGGEGLDVQRISWLAGRTVLLTAPLSIGSIVLGAVPFAIGTIIIGLLLRKKVSSDFAVRGYWISIAVGGVAAAGILLYAVQRGVAGLDHWFDFDAKSDRERASGIVLGFLWLLAIVTMTSSRQFTTMVRRGAQARDPLILVRRRKAAGALTRMARRRVPAHRSQVREAARPRTPGAGDRMARRRVPAHRSQVREAARPRTPGAGDRW